MSKIIKKVLVTGATGNVGSEIVRCLVKENVNIRAAASNDISAKKVQKGVETVILDFDKPETFSVALEGVSKVFLMRPPHMGDPKQLYPFIDACKIAKVEQVIFLSLLGVQYNPLAPHGHIEKYIKRSGIPYTFLRPSFFMQNLSTTHGKGIRKYDEITIPAGNGKTSFIDVRDIAAVAAKVLTEIDFEYKAFDLTGSEALSYQKVAEILSKVVRRKTAYNNSSTKLFFERMTNEGFSADFISVMKNIYMVNKIGLAGRVTDDVEKILGRKQISFEQFAKDNKELFICSDELA